MFSVQTIAMALILVSAPAVQKKSSFLDAEAAAIEAFLSDNFADAKAGMVVGLIDEHGSRVFSAGVLDNGTDNNVDGDTIFELGSITKPFTCLLMLDAARRNELQIDDLLAKHLPAGVRAPDWEGTQISLLHLASHDSGLTRFPNSFEGLSLKEKKAAADRFTVDDLYADLAGRKLVYRPGAQFTYSNVGYSLLGNVIERATGKDFDSLVGERVCQPLKMTNTSVSLTPGQKRKRARGHWQDGTRSEHLNFQASIPAGSLHSTANDMLKFLAANLAIEESPLTPLMKQMHVVRHEKSERFGKTSIGWSDAGVYNPPGSELWGHGGGGFGNLAFVGFDVKRRRGVVVMTNQMNIYPNGVGWTLLQEMPFTRANVAYAVRKIVGLGIGLAKDKDTGQLKITKVYPESPAGRAGIVAGGVILKIDQTPVKEKGIKECLELLAGAAGTKVSLQLQDSEGKSQTIELTRRSFLTSS